MILNNYFGSARRCLTQAVFLIVYLSCFRAGAQSLVTYAGGTGKEVFYDALPLSNGNYLVGGYADDLNWINANVPRQVLGTLGIKNGTGTNRIGFILHLGSDLKSILNVVHFPKGAVEDVRFIKSSNAPGQPTGSLFISGNTSDTKANNGGYFIAKLNNNFVSGIPTDLTWAVPLWAVDYPKTYHPWDVGSDGKVVYVWGESHGYNWAEAIRLDVNGVAEVVPNWRYHKLKTGSEFAGVASAAPGGASAIRYSSIIFKRAGRCDLRSWTQADYNLVQPDGNGGTKKGKWPLDVFYSGPGDPATGGGAGGKGYTGYGNAATYVYGPSAVVVDRRTNAFYIGMNMKSVLPDGNPDFEPAVLAYDPTGTLTWWSRLYHEIRPDGTLVNSSPDQYVDDLAIDYSQPVSSASLVVLARSHGNNTENLWEGNTVAASPGASGFQNQFTGNNGNIHLSWLGKLRLTDGTLLSSTYVGEYNEGTNNYGSPLADPNLDGWPNPNGGWPNLNSTRCKDVKIAGNGSVCVVCTGRKTITTANAFQKGVKPGQGTSPWSQFVRIYKPDLSSLSYSSLLTGQFDPATGAGGDNSELFNIVPVANGIIALGLHKENTSSPGTSVGNAIPTANVPAWGSGSPIGQSAILAYLETSQPVAPSATNGTGLSATYYDNQDFTGVSVGRLDALVNFDWGNGSPVSGIGDNTFSVQWRGHVQARYSENYTFFTTGDDGIRLKINGVSITNDWSDHGPRESSGSLSLIAGQRYSVELDYYENGGGAMAKLLWSSASQSKEAIPTVALYPAASGGRVGVGDDPDALTVYPNPVRNELTVSSPDEWSQLTVFGVDGQERINRSVYRKVETLNLQTMPTGLYFLRVLRPDGRTVTRKIVVE